MAGVEGRVVVVTGAGGGVGRAHALLFAEEGARVVVNDLGADRDGTGRSSEMAESVVAEIRDAGGEAVANADNVAEPEGGQRIVDAAVEAFGRIDVVVNNAGILRDVTFHKMTDEQWDAIQKVHLYGTYHVTRAAWPRFREQAYGRVIVTTSTSGLFGNFGQSNYGAAKMGLVGLINTLALEGAKYNVSANAVAPVAATRMTEDIFSEEMLERLDPRWVSPAVVHLASEDCTDTGIAVVAGGGNYSRVAVMQAPGANFDAIPTVDALAASWDQVTDLTGATVGRNPPD
ncbi:SDR family NAD(P)-dependent oxidoreductase [Egibacter rhizosphaerae]|uniref:SDR family NAD(P)-dependent oxidoreductase n=1 Tax=Egibacter rhizosphaerae TaxID=1670831 RepID=A0A411YG16_9ACTN|nr:SDR family NAD(P)-dependent oxidoreductase [Egibacter rhizosphaerae]QBI20032.1 SDR family NAD(P)-dependent oxidoreductase [Egibacter rhizosphaerae]